MPSVEGRRAQGAKRDPSVVSEGLAAVVGEFLATAQPERGRPAGPRPRRDPREVIRRRDSLDSNGRSPRLPLRLIPEREVIIASAGNVAMLRLVDALHRELALKALPFDSAGSPVLGDAVELAHRLGTDPDPGEISRSAELGGLVQVFQVACAAGAVCCGPDCATADGSWAALAPDVRWARLIDAVMDIGPASLTFGGYEPEQPGVVAAADAAGFYLVALLWVADRGARLSEIADLMEDVYASLGVVGLPGLRDRSEWPPLMEDVLVVLTAAGVVVWDDEDTLRLQIECGRMVSHWLNNLSLPVLLPEDVVSLDARGLLELATGPNGSQLIQQVWLGSRPAGEAASELIAEMTEHPSAANLVVGSAMLETLGTAAVSAVKESLEGTLSAQMWNVLVNVGEVDIRDVPPSEVLRARMDLLLGMADLGATWDMVEIFQTEVAPDDEEAFIEAVTSTDHPRAGELLERLGRHHLEVAKAERFLQAATEWRAATGPSVY